MSELVDPKKIEKIVGVRRHATEHWGRVNSVESIAYVLHSQACRDSAPDLRECPYSRALDAGIENDVAWLWWIDNMDRPILLSIVNGYLKPVPAEEAT